MSLKYYIKTSTNFEKYYITSRKCPNIKKNKENFDKRPLKCDIAQFTKHIEKKTFILHCEIS